MQMIATKKQLEQVERVHREEKFDDNLSDSFWL